MEMIDVTKHNNLIVGSFNAAGYDCDEGFLNTNCHFYAYITVHSKAYPVIYSAVTSHIK